MQDRLKSKIVCVYNFGFDAPMEMLLETGFYGGRRNYVYSILNVIV